MDSELVVRQMTGVYRVKHEGLKPLYAEAQALARRFGRFVDPPRAAGAERARGRRGEPGPRWIMMETTDGTGVGQATAAG